MRRFLSRLIGRGMIAFGTVGLATAHTGWWGAHARYWQLLPVFALHILSGFTLLVEGYRDETETEEPRREGIVGLVVWLFLGPQTPTSHRGNKV
jgi:hypothetical protein